MNSEHETYGKRSDNLRNAILLVIAILGLIFCIVGGILVSNYITYDGGYEIVKDYTDCTYNDIKCKDSLNKTGKECSCYLILEIPKLMKPPVTVFYELDSYDQMISPYIHSRDDNQLAGHLSSKPAASCGSYSYANTTTGMKPIAPCGQLADAMFNDTFSLQTNNTYVLNYRYDLITEEDKKQFHNPPGNLSEAFKDFAKPINWRKNVYELDTVNPKNNGFQNEAFIIWMNTDLKRKPAWHVNHTGLDEHGVRPANYTLRVIYGYPPSRYDGPRKFIISSIHKTVDLPKWRGGVTLLVFGPFFLVFAVVLLYIRRSTISWR